MQQKTTSSFLRDLGLFIQLPALLTLPTLVVIVVFNEWFALLSFGIMSVSCVITGQVLYRLNKKSEKTFSGSAFVLLSLSWFIIPVTGIIPFYGIALSDYNEQTSIFLNLHSAFFESMSGYTGTGLTMVDKPHHLPHVLQWWRSVTEWIGGLGMIFITIAFLDTIHESKKLYASEAMKWTIDNENTRTTVKKIWLIYLLYTLISILAFWLSGMPVWEAINHGLVGISTGGFTVTPDSFVSYSTEIKITGVVIMLTGALSFKVHYLLLIRRDYKRIVRQSELSFFTLLFILFALLLLLLNPSAAFIDNIFQAASALGTCGFNSVNLETWPMPVLVLLMIPMLLGGNESSTTGGIKTSRLLWMLKWIKHSLMSVLAPDRQEKKFSFNKHPIDKNEALKEGRTAANLIFLHMASLVTGTLIILFLPDNRFELYEIFFDVTSAINNVGLSSGMTAHENHTGVKWVMIICMWIGRLEIQAVLILIAFLITGKQTPKK
jgi:trk system potassium uptake protein